MQKEIAKLDDHYIVCGLGRMGATICEYLHARQKRFVVIESNEAVIEQFCFEKGWPHIDVSGSPLWSRLLIPLIGWPFNAGGYTIRCIFESTVEPLEWFSAFGTRCINEWNIEDGRIRRSLKLGDKYGSLILDAIK